MAVRQEQQIGVNGAPASRAATPARDILEHLRDDVIPRAAFRNAEGHYQSSRGIYTNAHLFELEMKYIFEGNWIYAAHESQIPEANDFITLKLGRQPILITRGQDGEIKAFFNACAHRGARVCREKTGNKRAHMCPFHGWTYKSDGSLSHITDEQLGGYPPGFDKRQLGLKPVPRVENYRGFIFVSLAPVAASLAEFLGDATRFIDLLVNQSPDGDLRVLAGETAYSYTGNWKLAVENGLDGYHVAVLHANYMMTAKNRAEKVAGGNLSNLDVSKWGKDASVEAGFFSFRNGHGVLYAPYPNFAERPAFAGYDDYLSRLGQVDADWMGKMVRNTLLFPNMLLMDQMSSQIRIVRPVSVDLTETVTYCIAPRGEKPELRQKRIRQYEDFFNASGMATPDDLNEFRNCHMAAYAAGKEYSDLSRGQVRWVEGANGSAKNLGIEPMLSSTQAADEGIYVGILGQWAQRMQAAVAAELEQ
ncbi:MAG: benzoate 1,2-dioxygenase large subunit [Salinisphaeraceae bacterium]|nr:benzoate 1,2-dioxygenase large subunit [Salinisphaeraceae bacterium]